MSDDLPSGKRIWALASEAIRIEKSANNACSLSYALIFRALLDETQGWG
jgi:hypothetical protein